MEPRARAGRHKATLNFPDDLRTVLLAYGAPTHPDLIPASQHPDSETYLTRVPTVSTNTNHRPTSYAHTTSTGRIPNPYPETLRVLDEILTDFVIETCHGAARHASLAGRQKINNKDFEFVIRRDKMKMGRVQDLLRRQKRLQQERKLVDAQPEGKLGEEIMADLAGFAGEDSGTGKGKGRGRGRRKKRIQNDAVDGAGTGGKDSAGGGGDGLVGEDDLDLDMDLDGDADVDLDLDVDGEDEGEPPRKRARSDTG